MLVKRYRIVDLTNCYSFRFRTTIGICNNNRVIAWQECLQIFAGCREIIRTGPGKGIRSIVAVYGNVNGTIGSETIRIFNGFGDCKGIRCLFKCNVRGGRATIAVFNRYCVCARSKRSKYIGGLEVYTIDTVGNSVSWLR